MKSTSSLVVTSLIVGGIIVIGLSWANAPTPKVSPHSPTLKSQPEAVSEINGVPSGASASDKALMARWVDENELCRGSSDKKTIDDMCPKRDRTQNLLSEHGWCWAYSDWRVYPTDYKWHSCSVPRPEGFVPDPDLKDNEGIDAGNTPTPALTKLIAKCDHGGCGDLVKPIWRTFSHSNGLGTKLNTLSVDPMHGGGAMATIYTYRPGSLFAMENLRRIVLTCRGQYADLDAPSYQREIPLGSVMAEISISACGYAKPKAQAIYREQQKIDSDAHQRALHPRPEDYCQGFSADACAQITEGVNAATKPPYCKPGYGVVGSGLSAEEIRICGARSVKDQ